MKRMRTVLVPLPPVHWGGLQTFAANLNQRLRSAGWRWLVVVPTEATDVIKRLRETGVDVLEARLPRFQRSPIRTLRTLWELRSDLNRLASELDCLEISIVQAVGAHHPHGTMLAARLRKPLVWQIHSNILPSFTRRTVATYIEHRSHVVMTNGHQVAKAFWGRESLGSRHFVFYAPVDVCRFAPNPLSRSTARQALGFDAKTVVLGTIGNQVWQKNHEFLVTAAAGLRDLYPNLRIVIFGEPAATYSQQYQKNVIARAAAVNAELPGFIQIVRPGLEVARWVQALDIFTLTSHAEGVPIALFEAMAAAKAVVSTNVGSVSEIVEEGATGFLVKSRRQNDYVARVRQLVMDESLRQAMGCAGQERIVTEFSIDHVVEAHVNAYETALEHFAACA